jgi:glycosyltransferase involved in cell wall biosynthesis
MVAPPWISIPAPTYGGIEEVVRLLCQGLVARGNHVTLYAAPDSESDARVVEVLDESHPDQIEDSLIEAAHVGSVFSRIDRERVRAAGFDVVHDHCPAVALAMADRLREPFVHTLHGPFDDERAELYRRQGHKATLVAISESLAFAGTGGC